jgi:non-specific serine/threonine protein kinase
LEGIASLVDKSLLLALPAPTARFTMLETIREFGLEQLAASGEVETVRQCHAACFLALAEAAEPFLRGPDQIAWLDRLEVELPNLRAAMEWLRDAGDPAGGMRLAAALWTFWVVHDHVPEGRRWLETFLAAEPAGSAGRLKALVALGDMCERLGEYASATTRTEAAIALARARGDRAGEAAALRVLGNVAISRGSVALHSLGDVALAEADFTLAETSLEQSLALARELGDEWGAAKALHWQNNIPWFRGNIAVGITRSEEAAATFHRLGDQWQLCMVLASIGILTREAGDLPRARAAFAESLGLARQLGYRWFAGLGLVGLAAVAAAGGEGERAARLLGAATALREAAGEPLRRSDQAWHDRAVATTRAALEDDGFAAAWASGAALPPDAAIAEALVWASSTSAVPSEPAVPAAHDGLTPREREVLRLLAEGLSDPEIAAALFVSRRTAATHVAGIFRKLGVSSRAAAAAYAVRHGLA